MALKTKIKVFSNFKLLVTNNKIWRKIDALVGRVNSPHIGNKECFQFVLQQDFINKT
jgi:hypothetical protein